MAQPDLEKFNRRGLAAVIQTTAGTPTAPSAAANGIRMYDGQSATEFDALEENRDRTYFSGTEFTAWNHRAYIEGTTHIYPPVTPGDASAGIPDCNVLLLVAGMTRVLDDTGGTTRYNPISDSISMATADFWHAGTYRRLYDARANISALTMDVGNRARAQLRLQGLYDDIDQQALASVTVPDELGPIVEAANAVTQITPYPSGVAGTALKVWGKSLVINFGTTLTTKQYTEHRENAIDDRKATFTLRLAKTDLDDFSPFALRLAGTTIEALMRVVNSDKRYTEFGIRGLIRDINEVDIDGDYGWEISGPCIPTDAGGDEFYIEFGTTT